MNKELKKKKLKKKKLKKKRYNKGLSIPIIDVVIIEKTSNVGNKGIS